MAEARHRGLVLLIALASTASASCGGERADPVRKAVSFDSAGVMVIESAGAGSAPEEAWLVSDEPFVTVGGMESRGADLYGVSAWSMLGDGTLVVAQRGELIFLDESGDLVTVVDGTGTGGPGEFNHVSNLVAYGEESVAAFAPGFARVSFFRSDGTHIRDVSIEGAGGRTEMVGIFESGAFVFAHSGDAPAIDGDDDVLSTPVAFVLHSADGSRERTVTTMVGARRYRATVDGMDQLFPVPFEPSRPPAVVGGNELYVADQEHAQIRVYAETGELVRLLRNLQPPGAVTPSDVESYRELLLRVQPDEESRRRVRAMLDAAPWPDRFAPITMLVVQEGGGVWACEGGRPEGESCWTIYGVDGRIERTVTVPPGISPLWVGRNRILTIARDDYMTRMSLHRIITDG